MQMNRLMPVVAITRKMSYDMATVKIQEMYCVKPAMMPGHWCN